MHWLFRICSYKQKQNKLKHYALYTFFFCKHQNTNYIDFDNSVFREIDSVEFLRKLVRLLLNWFDHILVGWEFKISGLLSEAASNWIGWYEYFGFSYILFYTSKHIYFFDFVLILISSIKVIKVKCQNLYLSFKWFDKAIILFQTMLSCLI